MIVEVGKYYIDGDNVVRYINKFDPDVYWPYICNSNAYNEIGESLLSSYYAKAKYNLVKEITKYENPEYFI